MGDNAIEARDDNDLFQHEYGHYLQSQEHGFLWLFDFALESGISAIVNDYSYHSAFYSEQDANARSLKYFAEHYGDSYIQAIWDFSSNPITVYNATESYRDNLSIIEGKIIHLNVSFRRKDGIENGVTIDNMLGIDSIIP